MIPWFCFSVDRIRLKWWSRLAVWESSMRNAFPLLKVIYLSLRCVDESDWILKIWNADSHYLFPSKPFAEPQMMPEWALWVDVVRMVRRNSRKDSTTTVTLDKAVLECLRDVYSWEKDEVGAFRHDVILVVEGLWEVHIGKIGDVWTSFIMDENHSREWYDED